MYSQQEEINTLTGSLFDVQYVLNTTALSPEQIFNYSRVNFKKYSTNLRNTTLIFPWNF